MSHLQAEGDIQLHAFRVDRIVAPIVGRKPPKPGKQADAHEAELLHATSKLANGIHRTMQVDGANAGKPTGVRLDDPRHVVVGQEGAMRTPPCAGQRFRDARAIERCEGELHRNLVRNDVELHPPPERCEHVVTKECSGRMLNPRVDDRRGHAPILSRRSGLSKRALCSRGAKRQATGRYGPDFLYGNATPIASTKRYF